MELVEILSEILKYVVPAALVLLAVKYMNDMQFKSRQLDHQMSIKGEVLRQHLPLKFSAYERAILFLERISPEHLLPRVNPTGKTVQQFHRELLNEIRSEYEHNLAQQIYIGTQGWDQLTHTKNELMSLINRVSKELKPEIDAVQLSLKIFEKYSAMQESPVRKAVFVLKSDIHRLFQLQSSQES